jgi:hypothetical protein
MRITWSIFATIDAVQANARISWSTRSILPNALAVVYVRAGALYPVSLERRNKPMSLMLLVASSAVNASRSANLAQS